MNRSKILFLIMVFVIITLLFYYGRNLANANFIAIGSFQKFTVIIALLLLLGIFIFLSGSLIYAKKDEKDDVAIVPQCPDFWEIKDTPTGPQCVNVQDLGTCPAAAGNKHLSMNLKSQSFTDNCAKYTWANNCKIAWDGITYGVDNPCIKAKVAA
jgi:hypothetical protein